MAYYGRYGRRRESPAAQERREREERENRRIEKDRARFARLLKHFRLVPLYGDAAQAAWKLPEKRSFFIGRSGGGEYLQEIVRGDGRALYLQRPSFPGWRFYRLVPKHHVLRQSEEERERDRSERYRR